MSLRHKVEADSLEMLLDTMCNTFGGIILIALLIALVSRQSRIEQIENRQVTRTEDAVQRQMQEAAKSLAAVREKAARLEAKLADPGQRALLQLIEERDNLRQTSTILAEALRRADPTEARDSTATEAQIAARVREITAQYQQADRQVIEERNLTTTLLRKIEDLRAQARQESNRLAQVLQNQVQRLRMPREHETEKSFLYVILRHGRMFPLVDFEGGETRMNETSLRWTEQGPNLRRIEPIPDRGMDPEREAARIAQFLRQVPQNFYVVFEVYEDSFPAFNLVKRVLAAQHLECTWEPRPNDHVLTLGAGARPPPPQ